MSNEQIRVVVRVRPLGPVTTVPSESSELGFGSSATADASKSVLSVTAKKVVSVNLSSAAIGGSTNSTALTSQRAETRDKHYSFDHVFDSDADQDSVYVEVGKPLADACLQGFNATILAYGQTGSGKTFTMSGGSGSDSSTRGLIPRMLDYIFERMATLQQQGEAEGEVRQFVCRCSFLEIYNERIADLLSGKEDISSEAVESLSIREDSKHGIYVEGLTAKIVRSAKEAQQLLELGGSRRHVAATRMNVRSSRSHTVFTMIIDSSSAPKSGSTKIGTTAVSARLHLVDLAGSENQRTSATAGARLKEASNINKSLSALGNVIMALTASSSRKEKETKEKDKSERHVPYRDSKLTFLLKDSLGGTSKTCLICNVSPQGSCLSETISTLNFAARAKHVRNHAVIQTLTSAVHAETKAVVAMLKKQHQLELKTAQLMFRQELQALQRQLRQLQGGPVSSTSSSSSSSSSSTFSLSSSSTSLEALRGWSDMDDLELDPKLKNRDLRAACVLFDALNASYLSLQSSFDHYKRMWALVHTPV